MFFTLEDYKKIYEWISRNSIRDTEFNEALTPLDETDTITLILNGANVRISLKDLVDLLFLMGVSDFLNITDKYREKNITLDLAIELIPYTARKVGQVITFLDTNNKWKIYLFRGELTQWDLLNLWEDILDIESHTINSILPDEEDLTKTLPDDKGNSYLSFKDREYNPEDFSGLGRVILRKNIMEVEDPTYGKIKKNVLYQDMFTQSNTIYEIRYDFDLNGQEITIPANCVLEFEGGSLNNGGLNLNNSLIKLNGSTIELCSPITLYNSVIEGNGIIKASANYQYGHIINMTGMTDKVQNLTIDINNNSCSGIWTGSIDESRTPYTININNINIINAVNTQVASISSIDKDVIITKSEHNLSNNDLIQLKDVNGGISSIRPTVSIYCACLYVAEVLSSTSIKLHKYSLNENNESFFNGYTAAFGGTIYKLGCGINVTSDTKLSYIRTCNITNVNIKDCSFGIANMTKRNKINGYVFRNTDSDACSLYNESNESVISNIKIDSTIIIRFTHGLSITNILGDFEGKDVNVFNIIGFNETYGNAGGETEGITIANSVFLVKAFNNPVILMHSMNFHLENCSFSGGNSDRDAWYIIAGSGNIDTFKNITIIGGNCHFFKSIMDFNGNDTFSFSSIQINGIYQEQGTNGYIELKTGRTYNSDATKIIHGTDNKIANTNMYVSYIYTSYNREVTDFTFENIYGVLDLTNIKKSRIINCQRIINYDISNDNYIVDSDTRLIPLPNNNTTYNNSYRYKTCLKSLSRNADYYIPLFKFSNSTYQNAIVKIEFVVASERVTGLFTFIFKIKQINSSSSKSFQITRKTKTDAFSGSINDFTVNICYGENTLSVTEDDNTVTASYDPNASKEKEDVKLHIVVGSNVEYEAVAKIETQNQQFGTLLI